MVIILNFAELLKSELGSEIMGDGWLREGGGGSEQGSSPRTFKGHRTILSCNLKVPKIHY